MNYTLVVQAAFSALATEDSLTLSDAFDYLNSELKLFWSVQKKSDQLK